MQVHFCGHRGAWRWSRPRATLMKCARCRARSASGPPVWFECAHYVGG